MRVNMTAFAVTENEPLKDNLKWRTDYKLCFKGVITCASYY